MIEQFRDRNYWNKDKMDDDERALLELKTEQQANGLIDKYKDDPVFLRTLAAKLATHVTKTSQKETKSQHDIL